MSFLAIQQIALGITIHTQYLSVVSPLGKIVDRCRPYHLLTTTVVGLSGVVRTIYIYTLLAWAVWIIEDVWLAIRDMFPHR